MTLPDWTLPDWTRHHTPLADDPVSGYDPDAVLVSDTFAIAAPPRVVWQVLIDMPRYNEWNPFCIRAVSTLEMDAPMEMTLINYAAGDGSTMPNLEYICAFDPERLISWQMKHTEAWPYGARRDQVIEPTGPDSCRYFSLNAFFGVNGIHVLRFAGPWIRRAFNDSGRALKARAEALYAAEN